jgi:purine-nucleoside phosphorylase
VRFRCTAEEVHLMQGIKRQASETARVLRARIPALPRVGILAGTGLGGLGEGLRIEAAFPYADIPHFPVSTVQSHAGRLLFGDMAGTPVAVMQGRFHLYEGYSPAEVTFPIRVMQELGVDRLLVTNAAGGLRPGFRPGDMMVIADHINLTGENPLVGENVEGWGPRFPDMTRAYDRQLIRETLAAAAGLGLSVHTGVYAGLKGPSMETPAETRYLRIIGADAVGFSTVQEVLAAVHAGMSVLGISIITNVNDPDHPEPAALEDIIATATRAAPSLAALLSGVARRTA